MSLLYVTQPPRPKSLNQLQFIELCQEFGGITDELLVSANEDIRLKPFWIKFSYTPEIWIDDYRTISALDVLEVLGYLPNGKDSIINNWPVA